MTKDIAKRLYELCQQSQFATAHSELYTDNANSTERNMQGTLTTVTGLAAI